MTGIMGRILEVTHIVDFRKLEPLVWTRVPAAP
jgi:hypothetical protein